MKLADLLKDRSKHFNSSIGNFSRVNRSESAIATLKDIHKTSKHQLAFVARPVENTDLFDTREEKSQTQQVISENPPVIVSRHEAITAIANDPDEKALENMTERNIFVAEMIKSSKYSDRAKGPIFEDGKVVRHSVVGPVTAFERHQKRLQREQMQKDADAALTPRRGSIPSRSMSAGHASMNHLPTMSGAAAFQTQNMAITLKGRQKDAPAIPKMSKEELMHEIDDIKTRQDKFYSDMRNSINKMSKTARLCLTKEERCLKKFEKMQFQWSNVMDKANGRLGRSASQSLVNRVEDQRVKNEQVEMLEIIKSDEERYGENVWRMTLRKGSDANDKSIILSKSRPSTAVQERPSSSVEVIRHPKFTPTPSNTWRTSFFRTSVNGSTERSIRDYMHVKVNRGYKKLDGFKASGDGIESLMVICFLPSFFLQC